MIEQHQGGNRSVLGMALVVCGIIAILGGIAVALTGDDDPTPAAVAGPIPSSSAPPPRFSGDYDGVIEVAEDPHGQAAAMGPMPSSVNVVVIRDRVKGSVTLSIAGGTPFVPLESVDTFEEAGGAFTATGRGPVTSSRVEVTASLTGSLIDDHLTGIVTYAGLPEGPISYRIDMQKRA